MTSIFVVHNIEVAHRLTQLPGKCERIHGHSMKVTMTLEGWTNRDGLFTIDDRTLDFGEVKKLFRGYLDENYDHHLLLNEDDPWAVGLRSEYDRTGLYQTLPGLIKFKGDPTTENIAKTIGRWACDTFKCPVCIRLDETGTNGVIWKGQWRG